MFHFVIAVLALFVASPVLAEERAGDPQRFADLESVKAFDDLMATVGELRQTILTDAASEREAAEGMRFLVRVLAMSQDVTGDGYPPAPHFARMDTLRRKIGGDNPDAEYDNVVWDGRLDYRITGNAGSVDHLSFTVLAAQPSGRQKSLGYLNERSLELDEKGNFTIWLTAEKPKAPGNWIQTGPAAGAGSILVRQYLGDRAEEELATYEIEVVGRERYDPLPPSNDAQVARSLQGVIHAVKGLGLLHRYVSPSLGEDPNSFKLRNSDDFGADISSSDNLYVIGTYDFAADEALIVEVEPLDVRFWNLAIENPWHESVDYMQRKTSRTHDGVTIDPDGKVRFLIAHGRTDHPNYLETGGHSRGFMTFRWVGERDTQPPLPSVTRLPLEEAVTQARALSAGGSTN
ncbi:MAG: DUF1214 domain-containing protein [Deltaproteobacteria bacterium]|jgi:hypothetical protein|nr:DUF1214 domain-containing protein [Deltaproteobacteria bacterium]